MYTMYTYTTMYHILLTTMFWQLLSPPLSLRLLRNRTNCIPVIQDAWWPTLSTLHAPSQTPHKSSLSLFFSPPGIMKSRTSSNKRRSSTGTGNGITKGGTGIAAVMVHHTGFEEFSKT